MIIVVKFYYLKDGGVLKGSAEINNGLRSWGFSKKDTTGLLLLSAKQIQMQVEYTPGVFESTMIYNKMVLEIMKPPFLFFCKNFTEPAEVLLMFKKWFHKEMY